ncbi:MAG: hypothetical protein CM1200mP41_05810 [Gammaproteobacteria bacterium]|nr:MAG: hypothetical protein CM1200mP41_05810 [Gammaproteobacteria bacterium]
MMTARTITPGKTPSAEYDVVIVGAGFSGLYMLHRLRGAGFTAVYWNGPAMWVVPGTGIGIRAPAATLKACSMPTVFPRNSSRSGCGPNNTLLTPKS